MGRWTVRVFLTCAALVLFGMAGSARAQSNEVLRQRRQQMETRIILEAQGARMRAAGQTQAQLARKAKEDAAKAKEAAKARAYKKAHRSLVVASQHPAAEAKKEKAAEAVVKHEAKAEKK